MSTRRTLRLDTEQRALLVQHRDHDPRPYVRERCAAMLKVGDGIAPHAVARSGLLRPRDPDTLYAWLDHYLEDGLAGLVARPQGGYRRHCL